MGLGSKLRLLASRALPQAVADQHSVEARGSRYGSIYVEPVMTSKHILADEGSYFVANNNAQAGILGSAATGWVATTPILIVANTDKASNLDNKRIYMDYINLVTTVVGSAASGLVNVQMAVYLDDVSRYVSGGSPLAANKFNPNMDEPQSASVANLWFGNLLAGAAGQSVRAICPLRILRPVVSATVLDVVGEQKLLTFGNIDPLLNGSITIANANNIPLSLPPIVIGPGQCMLLYIWQNVGATNVAATYAPEIGWWER